MPEQLPEQPRSDPEPQPGQESGEQPGERTDGQPDDAGDETQPDALDLGLVLTWYRYGDRAAGRAHCAAARWKAAL